MMCIDICQCRFRGYISAETNDEYNFNEDAKDSDYEDGTY